jgi:hypothetical protein
MNRSEVEGNGRMQRLSELIRSRLRVRQGHEDEHPDADLLSAFVEQGLSKAERTVVLRHLGECPECREIVAVRAEMEGTHPDAEGAGRRRAFAWWLSGGAVAAALGLIVMSVWFPPGGRHTTEQVAAVAVPRRAQEFEPDALKAQQRSETKRATKPALARLRRRAKVTTEPSPKPKEKQEAAETQAAAAPAQREPAAVAGQSMFGTEPGRFQAMMRTSAPDLFRLNSLWRLVEGSLERSDDGGATWEAVRAGDGAPLYALSATGADVWIGGPRGKLFHSGDNGLHWQAIAVTDSAMPLAAAITAIDTLDGQTIKLKTSAGEEWISRDRGAHWQRRQVSK